MFKFKCNGEIWVTYRRHVARLSTVPASIRRKADEYMELENPDIYKDAQGKLQAKGYYQGNAIDTADLDNIKTAVHADLKVKPIVSVEKEIESVNDEVCTDTPEKVVELNQVQYTKTSQDNEDETDTGKDIEDLGTEAIPVTTEVDNVTCVVEQEESEVACSNQDTTETDKPDVEEIVIPDNDTYVGKNIDKPELEEHLVPVADEDVEKEVKAIPTLDQIYRSSLATVQAPYLCAGTKIIPSNDQLPDCCYKHISAWTDENIMMDAVSQEGNNYCRENGWERVGDFYMIDDYVEKIRYIHSDKYNVNTVISYGDVLCRV